MKFTKGARYQFKARPDLDPPLPERQGDYVGVIDDQHIFTNVSFLVFYPDAEAEWLDHANYTKHLRRSNSRRRAFRIIKMSNISIATMQPTMVKTAPVQPPATARLAIGAPASPADLMTKKNKKIAPPSNDEFQAELISLFQQGRISKDVLQASI